MIWNTILSYCEKCAKYYVPVRQIFCSVAFLLWTGTWTVFVGNPTYMFCTGTASILHDRIFILYRLYCKLTDCNPIKSLASVFTKPRRIKHVVANSLVIIITVAIMKSVIIVIFLVQTILCDEGDEEASEKAQSTVVRSY